MPKYMPIRGGLSCGQSDDKPLIPIANFLENRFLSDPMLSHRANSPQILGLAHGVTMVELQDFAVAGLIGVCSVRVANADARTRRAEANADDYAGASLISGAVAGARTNIATSLRVKLIGAEAQIANLTRQLDDAAEERAELVKMASELLAQNARLHARLH
jgi:hypothetical protein